jgi:ribulose-phosphate 3-epimerase
MIGGCPIRLEVDGGINPQVARLFTAAAADTLVAGPEVFKGGLQSYAANIAAIRAAALAGSSQLAS